MSSAVMKSLLAGSLLLSGCATQSYCLGKQHYDDAVSIAPLEASDGLSLPQSPTALHIPPPPAKDEPFGTPGKVANSPYSAQCLDRPPPLPPDVQAAPPKS